MGLHLATLLAGIHGPVPGTTTFLATPLLLRHKVTCV